MAKILSYNSPSDIEKKIKKESTLATIRYWLNSQDKFTKTFLAIFLLVLIATPFIVNNYLDTRQHAAEPEQVAPPVTPVITYKNDEILVTFRGGVKQARIDKVFKQFNLTLKSEAAGVYDISVDPGQQEAVISGLSQRKEVQTVEKIPNNAVLESINMNLVPKVWADAPPTPCADAGTACQIDSEEQAFIQRMNQYRQEQTPALVPLRLSPSLQRSADWMSSDMGINQYVGHNDECIVTATSDCVTGHACLPRSGTGTCSSDNPGIAQRAYYNRIRDFGYTYGTSTGENIACGYTFGLSVFQGWKDSPGHNANMLGSRYRVMGLARVYTPSSPFGWCWTNDFGGVDDSQGAPDVISPTVSITSPANRAIVSGDTIVNITASDNVGVTRVSLYVDSLLFDSVSVSPYSFLWDTTQVRDGSHTLYAIAYDAAGNSTTSTRITLTVNNAAVTQPPSPTPFPTTVPRPTSTLTLAPTRAPTAPPIPTRAPTPTPFAMGPGVTMTDNFGRPDSTILGNEWTEVTGDGRIVSGQLRNTGVVRIIKGGISNDQTASADFVSVDSNLGPVFGIILRYKDPNNYYVAYRSTGGTSQLRISKFVNNRETVLKSINISNPPKGSLFRIAGKARGNVISLDYDGVTKITATDATFSSGSFGILFGGSGTYSHIVDNFSATVQ